MAKPGSLAEILGSADPDAKDEDDGDTDDFESAVVDAFPELEGETARIAAFKQAIMACMNSDY